MKKVNQSALQNKTLTEVTENLSQQQRDSRAHKSINKNIYYNDVDISVGSFRSSSQNDSQSERHQQSQGSNLQPPRAQARVQQMKMNQSQFDAYQQEEPVRPSSSTNVFSYQAHQAARNQNVKSNSMIPYSNNFPYEFTFDNGKITRNNRSPFDQNNQLNSAQK